MKTLNKVKIGKKAKIISIIAPPLARQKFYRMGFVKDAIVLLKYAAPLGDPLMLNVKESDIMIRCKDAAKITVLELSD